VQGCKNTTKKSSLPDTIETYISSEKHVNSIMSIYKNIDFIFRSLSKTETANELTETERNDKSAVATHVSFLHHDVVIMLVVLFQKE
jgi:hypothetical protein